MSEAGSKRGLKSYLATLVATVLFPILWMQALRLASRHSDVDPRARLKVIVAIAVSIGILLVGAYTLLSFFAGAKAGMYDSMNGRLAVAVGETEYQDQVAVAGAAQKSLPVIEVNLAKAQLALANATARNQTDPSAAAAKSVQSARDNVTKLDTTLADTRKQLADARARSAQLVPNHEAYEGINASIPDQDDAELRSLIEQSPAYDKKEERAEAAFDVKDRAVADMNRFGWLFLWPSLAGAFFAPLAFALGSVLRKAFVPSDTVGFKPYPGGAAGLFLLFGAFGLPSIPFAAWTFNDALGRSEEGQISL